MLYKGKWTNMTLFFLNPQSKSHKDKTYKENQMTTI